MGHTALCNGDATCQEGLMHFGHTAVFPKAPPANQGNHLQAKLAMWERPAPFFLRTVALMKARTVRLHTLPHHQRQFAQTRERGHRAMAVTGHPEGLTTLLTPLLERGQRLLMRRLGTRASSGHLLAPCWASLPPSSFQPTPPVNPGLPFSKKPLNGKPHLSS